jgi:general secretion pathway protein J
MKPGRGFTLIELLVAMAIVAVIGVIALGGLSDIIRQQTAARERADRWREIQFAVRIVTQDLAQIHPRPARDELGDGWQPSVSASPSGQFAVELSRGGWANPAGFARGTVLRVAYDWEDGTLVRFHWPVMDRAPGTVPIRTELLSDVANVEIRFMDPSGGWHLDWPPIEMSGPESLVTRPRVIEFAIELEDYGRIWRWVETGG